MSTRGFGMSSKVPAGLVLLAAWPGVARAQIETGACCAPDGSCSVTLPLACIGAYQGDGTTCTPGFCLGACCQADGNCAQAGPLPCAVGGGEFQGLRSSCAGRDCAGACCLPNGTCIETGSSGCQSQHGTFRGFSAACLTEQCGGACCGGDGACTFSSSSACDQIYQGDGTRCTAGFCEGACCQADGACTQTGPVSCTNFSGRFLGLRSSCEGQDCGGACCLDNGACIETNDLSCNGAFRGFAASCASEDCDGACCLPNGDCDETGPADCSANRGIFNGFPSGCADVECRGGCCFGKKQCEETGKVGCGDISGDYQGGGTACGTDCPSPMPTAFTYQGQLKQQGVPHNGLVDLSFSLWANETRGDRVADPLLLDDVEVINGLFTVELDFAVPAFNTNARWLEIEVCPSGGVARPCITLNPRQPLTPSPYALQTRGIFVDDAQRVGVGTKQPSERLHVNGNVRVANDANVYGVDRIQGFDDLRLHGDSDGGTDVYIAANGNVGIGTANPQGQLHVLGASGAGALAAGRDVIITSGSGGSADSDGGAGGVVVLDGGHGGNSVSGIGGRGGSILLRAGNGGPNAGPPGIHGYGGDIALMPGFPSGGVTIATENPQGFTLAVNGTAAKPGGGEWATLSDRRLKQRVSPLPVGWLDRLLSLRGYEFEYTPEAVDHYLGQPGPQIGLMAQEVEQVLPHWVDQNSEGYKYITERGSTALLIEALRDLRIEKDAQLAERDAQIRHLADAKDAEIAELKLRLERLEALVPGSAFSALASEQRLSGRAEGASTESPK